ncbi:MAG: methyltransferase domain-containing protein [Phenylobacterium sp.]|uniref:class I SAM-dependent methyltransferase n=1 Tax=Phenylobacterium sp. TaxID=1871053 RepID=UPI0025EAB2DD|nr:class I SAM-dependent methyltransferase [Phenylobacterium sp.]MBI1199534.1 methyltransferase domain-containing protein [Phenylobacterium sp.]
MDQRESFEAVADLYAEVRRGYPAALFDDLEALAGLGPACRVLEVGCGGGQATGDLAARAGRVLAIDPGAKLIDEARRRVSAPNADFAVSTFEAFEAAPGGFDLVASAQAWHWVDPEAGFPKAAAALADGGAMAVFGHVPVIPGEPFATPFKAIFDRYAPGAWGHPPPQAWYLPDGPVAGMFDASGLFGPVTHRGYEWTWRLDAEGFGRYLRTDSGYHFLPEGPRFALFDEMCAAVAAEPTPFDTRWETHLYVARRA